MTNIAELAFEAPTKPLKDARDELQKLKPAAEGAEKSADNLNKKLSKTGAAFRKVASGANIANTAFKRVASGLRGLVTGLTGIVTGAVAGFAFANMINGVRKLSSSVSELATLLPKGSQKLKDMSAAARQLADEFGTNAAQQIKSFYGAVSAGATTTAKSISIVTNANKLAIGGITDVATGVDILTTATNAYAAQGLKAAEASDALFVGMRAGKTTISELSAGLGNVVPIASSLGVSFDELVAGTAALTTQGLNTASSITSLRAILTAVAKPTKQATDAAKALGIDFSTSALRAKGLAGFLKEVSDKSGGSSDALAQLFGSVEALNGALAFAGSGGETFTQILGQMQEKAGATDVAFSTVAESLDYRWGLLLANLTNAANDFGTKLLSIIVPIGEGFQSLIRDTSALQPVLNGLIVVIAGLAASQIPALTASFVSLVAGMNAAAIATGAFTTAVTVAKVAVAALGGPIGVLFALIGGGAAAWLTFRNNTEQAENAMYNAAEGTEALNRQLGVFYGTAAPSAGQAAIALANDNYKLADSAYDVAKAELAKQKSLLQIAQTGGVNGTALSIKDGGISPGLIQPDYEKALARLTKAENDLAAAQRDRKRAATAVTGSSFEPISNAIPEVDGLSDSVTRLNDLLLGGDSAGGGGGLKGAAGGAGEALTQLQSIAKDFQTLSEPFTQATAAFNATKTALENGIITNDQYTASLQRIQNAFNATGGTSTQWAKIVGENTDNVAAKMRDLGKKTLTSLGDEFVNLAVDGKANFKDLAKSIIKDLLKIAVQALIVKPLLGFLGFSKGGAFGGGGLLASAKGNAFDQSNVIPFAKGGSFTNSVVNKPTPFTFAKGGALGVMGEAGPEAVMPLKRGPSGSLGVQMYGGAGQSTPANNNVEINNVYRIEGAVSEDAIVDQIKMQAETTKDDVKRSVVGWLDEYDRNGTV